MLRLSDFVTCIKRYYNQSRGVYIWALEHCSKMKLRMYLLTLINKISFMLLGLSDFVLCSTSLYIFNSGVCNYSLEHNVKLKFRSSDRINTIFKHCHP